MYKDWIKNNNELVRQFFRMLLNMLAGFGIFLILYGMFFPVENNWPWLDKWTHRLGVLSTLFGVIATASSIYLPTRDIKAEVLSRYITSPIVIVTSSIIGIYYFFSDKSFPLHVINGLAILGLVGGLLRVNNTWDETKI